MNENLIKLDSVGCYIDEVSGMTYPTNTDGTPDMNSPVSVSYTHLTLPTT